MNTVPRALPLQQAPRFQLVAPKFKDPALGSRRRRRKESELLIDLGRPRVQIWKYIIVGFQVLCEQKGISRDEGAEAKVTHSRFLDELEGPIETAVVFVFCDMY